MQRRVNVPKRIVRRITVKTTKKPQPRRAAPATPQNLPSIVVPNKGGGTRRIFYG